MNRRGTSKCIGKGKSTRPYEGHFNRCKRKATVGSNWNKYVGRVWTITYEEFLKFIEQKFCHYCGGAIHWPLPHGLRDECGVHREASNLDRVDNSKDYSADNCVVACWSCNRTRGDKLSYEEMLVIGKMRKEKC